MSSGSFENVTNKMCLEKSIYLIYTYKHDSALNILRRLICHKTQPNQNHIYLIYMYKEDLALNNQQWLICHKTQPNPAPQVRKCLAR